MFIPEWLAAFRQIMHVTNSQAEKQQTLDISFQCINW